MTQEQEQAATRLREAVLAGNYQESEYRLAQMAGLFDGRLTADALRDGLAVFEWARRAVLSQRADLLAQLAELPSESPYFGRAGEQSAREWHG